MARHIVGRVEDLPLGERMIVELEGRSIGVFHIHDGFYAIRNRCPHQAAELCLGKLTGTTAPSRPGEYIWERDGEIIRCPWHGWEFDIKTGQSVYDPFRCRVRSYEVTVESLGKEEADAWPEVETFPVTIEQNFIVVHV